MKFIVAGLQAVSLLFFSYRVGAFSSTARRQILTECLPLVASGTLIFPTDSAASVSSTIDPDKLAEKLRPATPEKPQIPLPAVSDPRNLSVIQGTNVASLFFLNLPSDH